MKELIIFYVVFFFVNTVLFGQYHLSNEVITPKSPELLKLQNQRYYYPIGKKGGELIYQMNKKGNYSFGYSTEASLKVYYNEITKKISDSANLKKEGQKIFRISQVNGLTLFRGFHKTPKELESKLIDELDRGEFLQDYQDFWVTTSNKEFKIKSFPEHYYDKDVEYSIDSSGKYIVISTYVSEYLRSIKSDSIITVFKVANGGLEKENGLTISCVECIKPQIVGNYIYYGKKFFYLRGADAYDWKIFRAPLFDLSKSELIAEYVEPILVSPDGKYLIGRKMLYGESAYVIVNITTKKFDYILGRDYSNYKLFYSPAFSKFAFDDKNHIIYIDYPKQFLINSVGSDAKIKTTTNKEDILFWKKYNHPPISK